MNMKHIILSIFGVAALSFGLSSCGLLETESPSSFDASVVFSNYDLAESSIFGITEAFCEVNSYRGRFLPWYGFNTDIEWYNTHKPGDGKSDIAAYNCEPNNAQMNLANGPYNLMYTAVERANLVIEGLREHGNVAQDKNMAYLLGEALTLRAMIYNDLIKAWGDVPARFGSITSDNIYVAKSSRDEIYKQIPADLEEAIPMLPWPGATAQTSRTDRINRMFAEGLYARIALAASGYAIRPEDGKVGTGDAGSVRLSSDPELAKSALYPKALAYLEDAIFSGTASLEPSYEQMWRNFNNMENLSAGPAYETLYVIPFGAGRGRWNFTFAVASEGAGISGGVSRGGDAGPVPTFFFKYADNDLRRDLTCINYKWTKSNEIEPAGISKWYFGKFRFEWMDAQPYTGGNDDGIKPVVMRYADVLLMASEIANELDQLPKAKQYFLPVRARACGEDAAESYVNAISGKDEMFSKIVDERAFEFCGEFLRKADLIRWNMLKTKLDQTKAELFKLRDLQPPYDFLCGDIWYQSAEDEKSIVIWGLKKGETSAPAGEWELKKSYVNADYTKKPAEGMGTERIEGIYTRDPEQYMFWPIFNDSLSNSQGALVNDYGY